MPNAFLLRFQEPCLPDDVAGIRCGTRTETKIYRENGGDADPRTADYCLLRQSPGNAGTATKTGISQETPDIDETQADLHTLPRQLMAGGTKTVTNVIAETDDIDPGQAFIHAIRRSPTPTNGGTKTITAVQAEMDDNDFRKPYLHTIPRCS
jgi:hypothetical protein